MRTLLHVEWLHQEPGGNSCIFICWSPSTASLPPGVTTLDIIAPERAKR